jgi:hypothetical protein
VSEVVDAGAGGASNAASTANDTDFSNDSGESSSVPRPTTFLSFKVQQNQDVTECEEYLSSLLNWSAEPYVSRSALSTQVKFGPFTLAELESSVKSAADAAGFFAYSHRGARKASSSCSVKFGCDCARQRFGKEKISIEQKERHFTKDLDEVVRDTCGKRKKQRKGGGCLRAHTQRTRAKAKECSWAMCLKAVVDKAGTWSTDSRTLWTLNGDPRCINNFVHSHHCQSPHKRKISSEIKEFICEQGESLMVHQMVQAVYRKFQVEVSPDQVKYVMKCNSIRNKERARGSCRSGGAGDAIDFLVQNMKSEVVLLLNNCATGNWFNGTAGLSKTKTTEILLVEYNDLKPKCFKAVDDSRVIDIGDERFLVWSAAWNYPSEKELFAAYPEVLQLDCMHGVTSSTDGFNAVGIDGNGHNIQVMRAFVANQDSKVFRWIFREAFPVLVPSTRDIRVFFTDGCTAMTSELEAACGVGQQFQCAKMFRCLFHLITKAFDDQYGITADGWQPEVKKLLFRLRKCETNAEFEACSEFVLRKIAGMPMLGEPQSVLRAQVLRFVKRRLDCAPLWVLKDQLHVPTRGCMATARVEGTHGHDRSTDRINARNSWFTSTKRHSQGTNRRHRAKQAWSRRQLGSKLLRDPMNSQISAFKRNDLEALDAQLLPWSLETLEEQGLLALGMKVMFTKKGFTPETKRNQPHAFQKPYSGEFAVWIENDEESDDGDELDDDQSEEDHCESTSDTSSSDDSSQNSAPSKKRTVDAAEFHGCHGDESDDEEEFDTEAYINECQEKPLPNHSVFRWVKVRKVTVAPRYDDKQKLTGKYVFLCDCGFQKRIGVCCRHILAVLFQMVLEIVGNAEQNHSEGDDNHSAYNDITSIDWSAYQGILQGLCSMNICSKIKYHAALHQKGHLFERDAEFFKTTLPKNVPQSFLEEFMPDVHQLRAIPRNGLPLNSDDIEAQTEVLFIYVNAALNLHRFSNTF